MNPALLLIGACFVVALALGIRARRGHAMTLEQWTVGGRGFGTIFVFGLMAGGNYTTLTLLRRRLVGLHTLGQSPDELTLRYAHRHIWSLP